MKQDTAPRRVLLSSFGPFPGVEENPSRAAAQRVAVNLRDAYGVDAEVVELRTRYDLAATALIAALDARRDKLDAVIALGVAAQTRHVRVETIAHNQRAIGKPDAEGRRLLPGEHLVEAEGPRWLVAPIPLEITLNHLHRRELHALPSADAGDYLCNELFYRMVRWGRRAAFDGPIGFLHIPQPAQASDLDETTLVVSEIAALWARLGAGLRP